MLLKQNKIVLLTSGQPTLNPRLVKEADALISAGYEVTVIYQFWNEWATKYDTDLLSKKKWKAIRVGGSPKTDKFLFWETRVKHKIFRTINKLISVKLFPELSIGRCSHQLYKKAISIPADIYIAHNLPALPAASKAAKKRKVKCGFDAEDFHRFENSDSPSHQTVKLNSLIENRYLPKVDYITAASPLIKKAYEAIFKIPITTILNVIDGNGKPSKKPVYNKALRLFWFSQTVGVNRGLENIIQAINLSILPYELHLLGEINSDYRQVLTNLFIRESGSSIHFHEPIDQDEIINLASKFDIGMAAEPGFSTNNNLALSNKIFTYIQAGIPIVASNTPAQSLFLNRYNSIGKLYDNKDTKSLTEILDFYQNNRDELNEIKRKVKNIARIDLNWKTESQKFLAVIKKTLSD